MPILNIFAGVANFVDWHFITFFTNDDVFIKWLRAVNSIKILIKILN